MMKKMNIILMSLLLLISHPLLAGDLYLLCHDEFDQIYDDVLIENGEAELQLNFEETKAKIFLNEYDFYGETMYLIKLKLNASVETISFSIKEFESFNIDKYICFVRD